MMMRYSTKSIKSIFGAIKVEPSLYRIYSIVGWADMHMVDQQRCTDES